MAESFFSIFKPEVVESEYVTTGSKSMPRFSPGSNGATRFGSTSSSTFCPPIEYE